MYLIKFPVRRDGNPVITTPEVTVRFKERMRVKKTRPTPIGPISEVERASWDKSAIQVRIAHDDARRSDGRRGIASYMRWFEVPANRAGILKHIRRLRAEDAEVLAQKDAEIETAQAEVRRLRDERKAIVELAFRNGESPSYIEFLDDAETHARAYP